jgi:uncharacterized membrane protein
MRFGYREFSGVVLAGVVVFLVVTAVVPVLQMNSSQYSRLTILGPDQTNRLPANVTAGQAFSLYAYVYNHEGSTKDYELLVKLGDANTTASSSAPADAPVILARYVELKGNGSADVQLSLTLQSPGSGQRMIFELWMLNNGTSQFDYTGQWSQATVDVLAA